jgi:type IV secretory pathway VirB10-like protein
MNIQPTLTTALGQRMVIVTTRDMMIPPELIQGDCSR